MNLIKTYLKDIIFWILSFWRTDMSGRATLLMYHSIGKRNEYFFNVSLENFSLQMQYLFDHGYQIISLRDLLERLRDGKKLNGEIVITFDDGYKDNLEQAFPVLERLNFPATIFMTTNLIGLKDKRGFEMLSAADLVTLVNSDLIEIAPHTSSHPKLAKLSRIEAIKEIQDSRTVLENILRKTCDLFAYPYGNYSTETISILRELGFLGAITVKEGTVGASDDLFTLRRNSIDRTTSLIQFRGKLTRVVDRYESIKHAFHGSSL